MNLLTFHMKILTFSIFSRCNSFVFPDTLDKIAGITESGRICYFCHWHLRPHQKLLTLLFSIQYSIRYWFGVVRTIFWKHLQHSPTLTDAASAIFFRWISSIFYLSYLLIYSIYFVYAMHYAPAFQAYCSISFLLSVYTTYILSHLSALSQYIFCIKFPQEFHFICRKLHIFP